jgi:hypothetical protein
MGIGAWPRAASPLPPQQQANSTRLPEWSKRIGMTVPPRAAVSRGPDTPSHPDGALLPGRRPARSNSRCWLVGPCRPGSLTPIGSASPPTMIGSGIATPKRQPEVLPQPAGSISVTGRVTHSSHEMLVSACSFGQAFGPTAVRRCVARRIRRARSGCGCTPASTYGRRRPQIHRPRSLPALRPHAKRLIDGGVDLWSVQPLTQEVRLGLRAPALDVGQSNVLRLMAGRAERDHPHGSGLGTKKPLRSSTETPSKPSIRREKAAAPL